MLVALRENKWRAALAYRCNNIVADAVIPFSIPDEFIVKIVKLNTYVRIPGAQRLKPRRTDEHQMFKLSQ